MLSHATHLATRLTGMLLRGDTLPPALLVVLGETVEHAKSRKQRITPEVRTAYHEAGHAVIALARGLPVHRVSILPTHEHPEPGRCHFMLRSDAHLAATGTEGQAHSESLRPGCYRLRFLATG